MAKKVSKTNSKQTKVKAISSPKFPYTTKPASLRRLLKDIPNRPKPPKIDIAILKSWGFHDNNDYTIVRVLKTIGLLNPNNETTELYTQFMNIANGSKALAAPIKKTYEPLFTASHEPYRESPESLRNLFNINSGGSESVIEQQIQTFKALCENADFSNSNSMTVDSSAVSNVTVQNSMTQTAAGALPIQINLHIHLPENKTRRDYECIIEDIARYIFLREQNTGIRND